MVIVVKLDNYSKARLLRSSKNIQMLYCKLTSLEENDLQEASEGRFMDVRKP